MVLGALGSMRIADFEGKKNERKKERKKVNDNIVLDVFIISQKTICQKMP